MMSALYIDFENQNITCFNFSDYLDKVKVWIEQLWKGNCELVIRSSGSTGSPKSITYSLSQAIASAQISNQYFDIDNTQILALPMDIKYVGAQMLIIRAWISGAKLWVIEPSLNPMLKLNLSPEDRIDMISMTPSQALVSIRESRDRWQMIRKCLLGGNRIGEELIHEIKGMNTRFYESFGMSETLSHFAIKDISRGDQAFEVLDGYEVRSTQRDTLGVYHPIITGQWLDTNDVVKWIDDRKFEYLGRIDHVVNSGGIKLQIETLEKAWSSRLDFPFYLWKESDETWGERLIIVVLSSNEWTDLQILGEISQMVENSYMIPKVVKRIDRFALTENGKLIRGAIDHQ